MKDLNALFKQCVWEVERVGIKHGSILHVYADTRLRSTWARCRRDRYGFFCIDVNAKLLNDDIPDNAVKDSIIHEILHTCAGAFNHGETWKELARRMNAIYGYNIQRTGDYAEWGIDRTRFTSDYKYFFKCKECGQIVKRKRKCDFTNRPNRWRCGICGGKFIEISEEEAK